MQKQEQVVRKASLIGNGAHIFVPKEWAGDEIVLVRKPKKPLRERILEVLEPYLEHVVGAFLFGSHARGEEREGSDIDLFVITDKKIKMRGDGFGIICVGEQGIEKAIKVAPVLVYSMLKEAKAIINAGLLERLRTEFKPNLNDFKDFIDDCSRIIKVNEKMFSLEGERDYTFSSASSYSLILRLRGIFITRCLLNNKDYSYRSFKDWINANVGGVDFDKIYGSYFNAKFDKVGKVKLKVEDLKKLLEFLRVEVNSLKNGKKKKKT